MTAISAATGRNRIKKDLIINGVSSLVAMPFLGSSAYLQLDLLGAGPDALTQLGVTKLTTEKRTGGLSRVVFLVCPRELPWRLPR